MYGYHCREEVSPVSIGGIAVTAPLPERFLNHLEKELHKLGKECLADMLGGHMYILKINYEEVGEFYLGTSDDAEVGTVLSAIVDFNFTIDELKGDWKEFRDSVIEVFENYGVDFKSKDSWIACG